MTNLIIHAGDHKTGTSTLQTLFFKSQEELYTKYDCLYVKTGRTPQRAHHNLAWAVKRPESLGPMRKFDAAKGGWEALRQELFETRPETALISSEEFERVIPESLQEKLSLLDTVRSVTIVLYVRPHIRRALSQYNTELNRGTKNFPFSKYLEFMVKSGWLSYSKRLIAWRDVFGESLCVLPYHKPHFRGDVCSDFFERILPNMVEFADLLKDNPQNSSGSLAHYLARERFLSRVRHLSKEERFEMAIAFRKRLEVISFADQASFHITPEEISIIRDTVLKDASILDHEFPDFEGLFLREANAEMEAAAARGERRSIEHVLSSDEIARVDELGDIVLRG